MTKKRFTDAEIWKKKWFRKLNPIEKTLWFYLKDNCTNAGLIEFDDEIISLYIGESITLDTVLQTFPNRVIQISDDKLYIVDFIHFQYGELSDKCNPHKPIIKEINRINEKYNIDLLRVPVRVPVRVEEKEKEKDKDKDKDKDKEKDYVTPRLTPDDIVQIWNDEMTPHKFSYCKGLGSGKYIIQLQETLKYLKTKKDWIDLFSECRKVKLLRGETDLNWKVNLTWLVDYDNTLKVLNGNYEEKKSGIELWFEESKEGGDNDF